MVSCHFSYRKWVVSKPYRTRFFTPASSGQDSKRKKVGGWSKRFQTCDDGKMSAVSACRSSACPNMHETWKNLQTHDHSCKSNLRHLSTNSASFCGQGTWSPAALQVPSFFLHFVRTRLGRWLQSFTVTVIRLTSVCAFSVLKSTDFLCWKAQLKIALFSLLFLQNNWQAWLLTNYKETCQQYSWWKVGSHATYQTFFHPLSSLDPKKIHDSKIRIILLEVVYFTMMMFWLSLHAARTHTHIYIYYIQTHLG